MTVAALLTGLAAILVGPVADQFPAAPASAPAVAAADTSLPSWDVIEHLDASDRDLVNAFVGAVRLLNEAAYALARRYPPEPLEIQVRDDLSRVRWRDRTDRGTPWIEAAVCPEDRALFARREGALPAGDADHPWRTLKGRGDRLLAPSQWGRRALLVRDDGGLIRLLRLD